MKKALIISVGTGTRSNEKSIKSVAGAITFSIQNHNPAKVFFIATKESAKSTLPIILSKIHSTEHDVIEIGDPDNIRAIYEELKSKFLEIKNNYRPVVVDYTSGTKAMTGSLAILSAIFEADTLSYVGGKRKGGIVMGGTEELQVVRPIFVVCEKRIREAIKFFNECRFPTTLSIINAIRKMTADKSILDKIAIMRKATLTYSAWDRFNHCAAFSALKSLKETKFDGNKRFLGRLLNDNEKEPYLIADLINNAKRRGNIERKFDDAVARLYRTVELMAQYRLRKEHEVDSSDLDAKSIPAFLREKWNVQKPEEKIKISLERAYELLAAKGDDVGKAFVEDKEFRGLLSKRNLSILAHGLEPMKEETYQRLLSKTLDYAESLIPNLSQHIQDSTFVKLNNESRSSLNARCKSHP